MTSLSDWSRLLGTHITTPLPDAGLGPMTGTTQAGRPNAFVQAGAARPQDPLTPAYQGAADAMNPMNFHAAGGLLAKGAMEAGEGAFGQAAADTALGAAGLATPSVGKLGAFIGLGAMQALHKGGYRPPKLPKGLGTEKSYEDFRRIMPYDPDQKGLGGEVAQNWVRDNWDNTGWVGRGAWGSSPAKEHGLRTTEPVAWVPFSDVRLRPGLKEYEGPLGGALVGDDVPALFAAERRLADLPAEISTVYRDSPRGSIKRFDDTRMPKKIELFGGNADEAMRLGRHEIQHAFDIFDNPSLVPGFIDGTMPGTPAEAAGLGFFRDAQEMADALGLPPETMQEVGGALSDINKHAFYLQSPWEQIARETSRRYAHDMSPRTLPGTYGGANPWAPDAMAPSWDPTWWNMAGIDHSMFQMPYKQR